MFFYFQNFLKKNCYPLFHITVVALILSAVFCRTIYEKQEITIHEKSSPLSKINWTKKFRFILKSYQKCYEYCNFGEEYHFWHTTWNSSYFLKSWRELPWRLRQAGWVWYARARETRESRVTIGWLLPVRDILKSPRFSSS